MYLKTPNNPNANPNSAQPKNESISTSERTSGLLVPFSVYQKQFSQLTFRNIGRQQFQPPTSTYHKMYV